MQDPDRWPADQGSLIFSMICLKRYIGLQPNGAIRRTEFGRLFYNNQIGHYIFVPEEGNQQTGGSELLVAITKIGWMVD